MKRAASLPEPTNTMMTLASLAATSYQERPSGETTYQQQQRILLGLLEQCRTVLDGAWVPFWVGLSADRANLAYLAVRSGTSNEYAVVIRGTMPSTPIDSAEDTNVGTLMPFVWSKGGNVSQGAMEAFTEVTSSVFEIVQIPPKSNVLLTLLETLQGVVSMLAPAQTTIYVTGHSLGGATATTVALFLSQQQWAVTPSLQLYTFAAPTAGDAGFAAAVNQLNPTCVYNEYDIVPRAWADLAAAEKFYPAPGPYANPVVKGIIGQMAGKPGANAYVQPTQQAALNTGYQAHLVTSSSTSTEAFMEEIGYQHANSTYLTLLGASVPPPVGPVVTALSVSSGPVTGGTAVVITGSGFSYDSVVDFGTLPGTNVVVNPPSSISVLAPAFVGTVDVRVTNMLGTSEAVPADWFSSPPLS